jgi:hypothetical protein
VPVFTGSPAFAGDCRVFASLPICLDTSAASADITFAVFTLFNTLRFLACIPQIAKALKDQSGAEAISFGTWALFLAREISSRRERVETWSSS